MNDRLLTLQAHMFAMEMFYQGEVVKSVFEDMEEVWLKLYTKDKKCPIVEQVGTFVKRKLVKEYAIHLIRQVRGIYGLTLATKTSDPDAMFWIADDIIQRIADGKTENHEGLFKTLFNALFGTAIEILNFMLADNHTKESLYAVVKKFYVINVVDNELDDPIDGRTVKTIAEAYLDNPDAPILFAVPAFS